MPPVLIAGGIAAAGAIGSAVISNRGTSEAAETQSESNAQSLALQRDIYNQNRQALSPYMQAGQPALTQTNAMLGLGTAQEADEARNDFRNYIANSDYGFQFGEGANALNSGYAGAGVVRSGAAMKGLENYRQNLQSGYRNEYMGYLGQQQGLGLAGSSALAGVGQGYANNVSNLNTQNANVLAQLQLQRANNTAGAIGAVGQIAGYAAGNVLNPYGSNPSSGWGNPGLY